MATRNLTCAYADGSVAAAELCLKSQPPPTSQVCSNFPCPHWHRQLWSACDKPCADASGPGTQTREVKCRMPHDAEPYYGVIVEDETLCPDATSGDTGDGEGEPGVANGKPPTIESCNIDACPSYFWKQTALSACSVPCGGGVQSAKVICVDAKSGATVNSNLCVSKPPESTLACNTDRCPNYVWVTGNVTQCSSFCGTGIQTR